MTIDTETLAASLSDVRRAYRLVYAYQRSLWDLLAQVDRLLVAHKLEFGHWEPQSVDPVPKRGTPFFRSCWAWDLLPAYDLGCMWEENSRGHPRARRVYLIAKADTGYNAKGEAEPDPADFTDAAESRTTLKFGLWTAWTSKPDWKSAMASRDGTHDMKAKGSWSDDTYSCRWLDVDVVPLVDQAALERIVLGPLRAWLEESAR